MDTDTALAPEAAAPTEAPAPAAAEPASAPASRLDTIREAVERQKERAAPIEGKNPNAPPKPAEKPAQAAPRAEGERPRAPDGKFAPAADKPAQGAPAPAARAAAPEPQAAEAAPDASGAHRPPPGWSPASKVAFDSLPDHVKADIAKREAEVNQGLAKLQEYKPVDKYLEMAKRGGTTLDRALEQYTGIENLLRRDVFAGVEQVLRNVGVNPVSFARAYLQRSGGSSAGPDPSAPPARQPAAIDPNAIVRQATSAVRAEFEARQVQSEIERFAADPKNRFFANVQGQMAKLVQGGFVTTIQDAYDMACRMDPEISRLLNQPAPSDPRRAAAEQARSAAKATIGAPSAGANPSAKPALPKDATRRDVIRAAVEAQRGARA